MSATIVLQRTDRTLQLGEVFRPKTAEFYYFSTSSKEPRIALCNFCCGQFCSY